MTSSRSRTSTSSALATAVALLLLWIGTASAGGRKRVVVLDFEGPKAEKFHADIVKLIKKSHTVVATSKWNSAADELGASEMNEKSIKKVARKLKVDGVITGKIEKRRDAYIVQLKLRSGKSGEEVGNQVDTKANGPKLDSKASRDVKDELLPAIEDLEANHGGDDDDGGDDVAAKPDDDPKPKKADKHKKHKGDDEEVVAKKDDDDEGSKKSGFGKRDDDERGGDRIGKKKHKADDDDTPKKSDDENTASSDEEGKRPDKKRDDGDDDGEKKVAKKDEDTDDSSSAEAESDEPKRPPSAFALSPAGRAVDAVVGLSFTARRLTFNSAPDLATPPPGYKQSVPVAGALADFIIYPFDMNHTRKDLLAGLGVHLMYDKVIKINSQKYYTDMTGAKLIANIPTAESRFSIGGVFRYPLGKKADAMVVGARVDYSAQAFELGLGGIGAKLPNGDPVDIPSVDYNILEVAPMLRYPVTPQITLNADLGLMLLFGTGEMQTADQYGKGSVTGFEGSAGLDYMITKNVFARGAVRVERIGFAFDGSGKQTTMRDADPEQDVFGAADMYYGAIATVGYAY